ncbi:MAG: PCRF domain-containing protein [Patescibacteria group bacterium]
MPPEQIQEIKSEYLALEKELINNGWDDRDKVARFGLLGKMMALAEEYEHVGVKILETRELLKDPEMTGLVKEEIEKNETRQNEILAEIDRLLSKEGDADTKPKGVVVEIRAGAGGEEAALFAGDLFTMYSKYAERISWPVLLISASHSDLGGFKEVIFEIKSPEAHEKLKQEFGVHRIQRVPKTEKSGRIHTSTASVAILPIYPPETFEVKPEDIEITFTRSSGPGGQNVNKLETAVRIVHKPSGLMVVSQNERSQAANRERAMEVLRAKLIEEKRAREEREASAARREQIGTADRSEKIRTYNFLQDRITDHRIKKSWHNIENILSGNLEPIIESFK